MARTEACEVAHLTMVYMPREVSDGEWVVDLKCERCQWIQATLTLDEYLWTVQ